MTDRTIKTLVDMQTGPSRGEMAQKTVQSIADYAAQGYGVVSVSHACDPADEEDRFSALIFLERG